MTLERLHNILLDWRDMMQRPSTKLGYPSKSLGIASGNGSYSNFDFEGLIESNDLDTAHRIDALIDSLPVEQREAINSKYLGSIKKSNYEINIGLAMDNLCTMADKRGIF